MITTDPNRPDAVSAKIHEELFEWLVATAETAITTDDVRDVLVGASAGLANFAWVYRRAGVSRKQIAENIAQMVMQTLLQLPDDGGVQ